MKSTLQILDHNLEMNQGDGFRPHGGASGAGKECPRSFWYDFRWTTESDFDANVLRKFRSGHADEEVVAEELEKVVNLGERQARFKDGHLGGSVDGIIRGGLVEDPTGVYIWEHKSVGEKYFAELEKKAAGLSALGRSDEILLDWRPVYYAQAQLYMHYLEIDRHYLTVSTGGARRLLAVFTPYDERYADELVRRSQEILTSLEPPRKAGTWDSFVCRWCSHSSVCHDNVEPVKSCRSCRYAWPKRSGEWICMHHDTELDLEAQRAGCSHWCRFLDK